MSREELLALLESIVSNEDQTASDKLADIQELLKGERV